MTAPIEAAKTHAPLGKGQPGRCFGPLRTVPSCQELDACALRAFHRRCWSEIEWCIWPTRGLGDGPSGGSAMPMSMPVLLPRMIEAAELGDGPRDDGPAIATLSVSQQLKC
jgi:hypothetical protein